MSVPKRPTGIQRKKSNNVTEKQPPAQATMPPSTSTLLSTPHTSGLQVVPPSEEQVRRRAYEIYESQGRPEGRHEEHWRQAEAEVRGRSA